MTTHPATETTARTYTQAEVEQFFSEAEADAIKFAAEGYQELSKLSYLRTRFQVGGAA